MRRPTDAQIATQLLTASAGALQPWVAGQSDAVRGAAIRAMARTGAATIAVQSWVDRVEAEWAERVKAHIQSEEWLPFLAGHARYTAPLSEERAVRQAASLLRARGWSAQVDAWSWGIELAVEASPSMVSEAKERRLDRASGGAALPGPVRLDPVALRLRHAVWMAAPCGERLVMPAKVYSHRGGTEARPEGSKAYRVPGGVALPPHYSQVPGYAALGTATWTQVPAALRSAQRALNRFERRDAAWIGGVLGIENAERSAKIQGLPENPAGCTAVSAATPAPCWVSAGFSLTASVLAKTQIPTTNPPQNPRGAIWVRLEDIADALRVIPPSKQATVALPMPGAPRVLAADAQRALRFLRPYGDTCSAAFDLYDFNAIHLRCASASTVLRAHAVDTGASFP